MTLRREKREAHRAADAEHVGELQEAFDDTDLVAYLGPTENRDERALRVLHDRVQRAHLALHQSPGGAWEAVGDTLGAGMRTVRGPEGIVHVHVGELGQRRHQLVDRCGSRRTRSARSRASTSDPARVAR